MIPEGASDGTGNLGYINAVSDVLEQEKQLGLEFADFFWEQSFLHQKNLFMDLMSVTMKSIF